MGRRYRGTISFRRRRIDMKFDTYTLVARFFPAVINGIPLFVIYYFSLRPLLSDFFTELLGLTIISDVTVAIALVFFLAQINRYMSKEIFEKRIFSEGLHFPTTSSLLHGDTTFSAPFTLQVHTKVYSDFSMSIPSAEDERSDEMQSRKVISEAVMRVRSKVGKGTLTHQHNIEYGFIRNLVGGAIFASITSLIGVMLFATLAAHEPALILSAVLLVLYVLILIFGKRLITNYGMAYAKVLIQEYMSI